MRNETADLSYLLDELPPVVARKEVRRLLGGMVHPRTLANLDSLGEGPKRFYLGRAVVYKREDLVAWLEERTYVPSQKNLSPDS